MAFIDSRSVISSLVFGLCAVAAHAGPLSNASISATGTASVDANSQTISDSVFGFSTPGTFAFSVPAVSYGVAPVGTASSSGYFSSSLAPLPTLSASSFANSTRQGGGAIASAATSGDLYYAFRISGPSSFVSVQINALAQLSATDNAANGNGYAIASLRIFDGNDINVINDYWIASIGGIGQVNGVESGIHVLQTNVDYNVRMSVSTRASTSNSFPGDVQTSAFLDPSFQIAQSVPDASLFSFEFSPGIGNGTPAATPDGGTTLAMLGAVVAGLVGLRRKI